MKHVLHHYTWLLHRFWPGLLFYSVLWIGVVVLVWTSRRWFNTDDLAYTVHLLLPLLGASFFARAVMEDRATGTTVFWRTRPPRWGAVWTSQFLFLLTVAAPPLCGWLVNGLLLNNTSAQWRGTLWETGLLLCPLLALAGVASVARGWYSFCIAVVAFAVCWLAGFFTVEGLHPVFFDARAAMERLLILMFILPALACAVLWMTGMKSGWSAWRAAILVVVLVTGPLLLSYAFAAPEGATVPERKLVLHRVPASGASTSGTQRMGDVELSGIPAGCVAVTMQTSVEVRPVESSPPAPVSTRSFTQRGRTFHTFTSLSSLFPGTTRWYHAPSPGVSPPSGSEGGLIRLPLTSERPLAVKGMSAGWIVRPEVEHDIPLAEGSSAGNGFRVRLRHFRAGEKSQVLSVVADIWRTNAVSHELRGDGTVSSRSQRDPLVPVLYFPALSLAIVPAVRDDRSFFRSWQTVAMSWELEAAVPIAEAIRGVRWDQDTLSGARLVFCRLRIEGSFTAVADEAPLQLPPPADRSAEIDELIALLQLPKQSDRRTAFEIALIAMGEPALRRLIAINWENIPFPQFAGRMFASAPPELLGEAARRDDRWVNAALQAGLTDQARTVALQLLRESPARLRVDTLSAAVALAGPADYPALQRQLAMHRPGDWRIDTGSILLNKFWAALRSLPGFDWETPALREWRKLVGTGRYLQTPRNGLRFSAALAGDVTALTGVPSSLSSTQGGAGLLDLPPLDNQIGANALTTPEWNQLAALMEGFPPDHASQGEWLKGKLVWDEPLGKYRMQN